MLNRIVQMSVCVIVLAAAGCSSSRIYFAEPAGARLLIVDNGKEFIFPAMMTLPQTENPKSLDRNSGGSPINLVLQDGTKLRGFLYVYHADFDQMEELAEVRFVLTPERIAELKDGSAVTIIGYSARNQPIYKVILGIQRS